MSSNSSECEVQVTVEVSPRGNAPMGLLRLMECILAAICVVGEGVAIAVEPAVGGAGTRRLRADSDKFKPIDSLAGACLRGSSAVGSSSDGLEPRATNRSFAVVFGCAASAEPLLGGGLFLKGISPGLPEWVSMTPRLKTPQQCGASLLA